MSFEFVFTDVPFLQQRGRRINRLLRVAVLIMLAGCVAWLAIAWSLQSAPLLRLEVAGIAASVGMLWLLHRDAGPIARHLCTIVVGAFVLGIIVLEANMSGRAPVLHLYLLCIAVAAFLVFFDANPIVPWTYAAVCFGLYVARQFEWLRFAPVLPDDAAMQAMARHVTFVAVFVIVLVLTRLFVRDIAEAERQLAVANARLEVILDNMLPEPIAERLRAEGHTFADAFVSVTILFADVVGFSKLAAEQPADKTVSLLDELFSRFDDLVDRAHNVEKIKTDGDTYMVAAGVPQPRPDHAHAIAELALAMRDEAHKLGLDLRIGINSGPVVAGVIGRRRFTYDLWGDAVNVASRMQSGGLANEIQVTDATRKLLDADYEFATRGLIEFKGRGKLNVHLLRGPKQLG